MSAVGHYLEEEGIATTGISLVREHSEAMRPPRALWVPFMLGRPLGAPNAPQFQRRVLLAALRLLEAPAGPVLQDFTEEAPPFAQSEANLLACPVSFDRPLQAGESAPALTLSTSPTAGNGWSVRAFLAEVAQLRTWHDEHRRRHGRTTVGISGLEIGDASALLASVLDPDAFAARAAQPGFALQLKRVCDDLRAFYEEALAAQPGDASPASLRRRFWSQTAGGAAFLGMQKLCLGSGDPALEHFGKLTLVPHIALQDIAGLD